MSKLSKEETARFGGANWMLDFIKEHGIEEAEKELEYRGIRKMPLGVSKPDVDRYIEREKQRIIALLIVSSCLVLRDEYGFGYERINRFIERFNIKVACVNEKYTTLKEMQETIKAETGLEIKFPDGYAED